MSLWAGDPGVVGHRGGGGHPAPLQPCSSPSNRRVTPGHPRSHPRLPRSSTHHQPQFYWDTRDYGHPTPLCIAGPNPGGPGVHTPPRNTQAGCARGKGKQQLLGGQAGCEDEPGLHPVPEPHPGTWGHFANRAGEHPCPTRGETEAGKGMATAGLGSPRRRTPAPMAPGARLTPVR